MQLTIFAITLVIMAVTLVLILRAILPTTGSEPDAGAPKMRTRLILVMIAFGVILSVISRTAKCQYTYALDDGDCRKYRIGSVVVGYRHDRICASVNKSEFHVTTGRCKPWVGNL